MKTQWNTGRAYTAAGQRIVAEVRDGKIWFNDIDRMICGVIDPAWEPESEGELRTMTMGCYDHGHWKDAQNHQVPRYQD